VIREYQPSDVLPLLRMHEQQGFAYSFPDLRDPLFVTRLVAEENGRVTAAALLHLTCEAYFLQDPRAGTPRERWERLLALHEAARRDAASKGLRDVTACIPREIPEGFFRKLKKLGWVEERFRSMCRSTD
jgi:hypothetical protein